MSKKSGRFKFVCNKYSRHFISSKLNHLSFQKQFKIIMQIIIFFSMFQVNTFIQILSLFIRTAKK